MASRVIPESPISRESLEALIASGIAEEQTLEYKRAINVETGKAKLEFCADVAAFANSSGGDIIFGMDEDGDGKAKALKPLAKFYRRADGTAASPDLKCSCRSSDSWIAL